MGLRLELPLTEGGQKTPTGKKNLFYSYGGNENSAAAPAGRAATSPMPAAPAWGQAAAAPPASRPCRRRGAGPGPGDHHTASAVPHGGRARLGPAPAQARSAVGPVSGSGTCRQGSKHPAPHVRALLPQQDPRVGGVWLCHPAPHRPFPPPASPPAPTAPLRGRSSALSYLSPPAPSQHRESQHALGRSKTAQEKAPHAFLAAEQLRAAEGQRCWGFPPWLPHYPPHGAGMLPVSKSPAPTAQGGS